MKDNLVSSLHQPLSPATKNPFPSLPRRSSWLAADPSKAYYEKISLIWAPLSMLTLLVGVFATPLYKYCDRNSYLAITVIACLPGFLIPLLFPCDADRSRPYTHRFWFKANIWISIFGFYGNYFWTHYFYKLLGAEYLFDSYRFNDVPLVTYTATFFYFTFYFNFVNLILRRIDRLTADLPAFSRSLLWWSNIFALSYATALFEALSIQHFPLYTYTDRDSFLLIGSVVYALYFIVGFPIFFALDENYSRTVAGKGNRVSCQYTATTAFAATAIVTLLLDLWRLLLGSIYELGASEIIPLPFIYQTKECEAPPQLPIEEPVGSMCKRLTTECAGEASSWLRQRWSSVSDKLSESAKQAIANMGSG